MKPIIARCSLFRASESSRRGGKEWGKRGYTLFAEKKGERWRKGDGCTPISLGSDRRTSIFVSIFRPSYERRARVFSTPPGTLTLLSRSRVSVGTRRCQLNRNLPPEPSGPVLSETVNSPTTALRTRRASSRLSFPSRSLSLSLSLANTLHQSHVPHATSKRARARK